MNRKLFKMFVCIIILVVFTLPATCIGDFDHNTALEAPPANDDFDNATVIEMLPFNDGILTTEVTSSYDDPYDCTNNGSVWYVFTPTTDMKIEANAFGSDNDTVISCILADADILNLSLIPAATKVRCDSGPQQRELTTFSLVSAVGMVGVEVDIWFSLCRRSRHR